MNLKFPTFGWIVAIILVACGPSENIKSVASQEHVALQSLPLQVIPPDDHIIDLQEPTFHSDFSFLKYDLHRLPIQELQSLFEDSTLAKDGVQKLSEEKIKWNGKSGQKFLLQEQLRGLVFNKEVLLIPLDSITLSIIGAFPKDSLAIAADIRKAMRSTVLDFTLPSYLTKQSVYFDFKDLQEFKLVQILNAGIKFTNNGEQDWGGADAFYDAYAQHMKVTPSEQKAFLEKSLSHLQDNTQVKVDTVNYQGRPGYELVDSDAGRLMYRVYLFDSTRIYQILAAARVDQASYLEKFKRMTENMVILQ